MITVKPEMQFVPGFIHGLQQSGLIGGIRVEIPPDFNATKLTLFVSHLIDAVEPSTESIEDASLWVVQNYFRWFIALQQQHRIIVSDHFYISPPRKTEGQHREYDFVLPYSIPAKEAMACLNLWATLIRQIVSGISSNDSSNELQSLVKIDFDKMIESLSPYCAPSVNRYFIAEAAFKMDIPIRPLRSDIYCIGTGCHARLVSSSITDSTPMISVLLARNKMYTADLLRGAGFPAATHAAANSADHAVELAHQLGMPVVIKPTDLDEGKGVAADLRDDASVAKAFTAARSESKNILVEKHFEGSTHRLTIFQGRLIKVSKSVAAGVVGDGKQSIRQLVSLAQKNPRLLRLQRRHGTVVFSLDEEAESLLAQENLTADSILESGTYIRLRRRDNVSAGGSNVAIPLQQVHPDNQLLAIRAAQLLRLDFAGVDLIISDINRSWLEIGGLICEINAQPTMGISDNKEIYHDILSELLPTGGRIPAHIALVFSSLQTPQDEINKLQSELSCHGLSSNLGLWLHGNKIANAFTDSFAAARALLNCIDVKSALCVIEAAEIIQFGLPLNKFDSMTIIDSDRCTPEEKGQLEQLLQLIENHVTTTRKIGSHNQVIG